MTTITELDSINLVRIRTYGDAPKIANYQLTILQDSYGEDGVYFPSQSISMSGKTALKLRDLLNTLPLD